MEDTGSQTHTAREDTEMAFNPNRPIPTNENPINVGGDSSDSVEVGSREYAEERLLEMMNDNVLRVRKLLIIRLERGKDICDTALKNLRNGKQRSSPLNELGEMQSMGSDIDALCGRLHEVMGAESKAAYALGFEEPSTDTCWRRKHISSTDTRSLGNY
jgi:hypothetical protein